jgi:hypothetical protein
MFEISHADLSSEEGGFHALPVFRPAYLPVFPPGICRKNYCIWESEYIQGP